MEPRASHICYESALPLSYTPSLTDLIIIYIIKKEKNIQMTIYRRPVKKDQHTC
jgi:hypothetical protein